MTVRPSAANCCSMAARSASLKNRGCLGVGPAVAAVGHGERSALRPAFIPWCGQCVAPMSSRRRQQATRTHASRSNVARPAILDFSVALPGRHRGPGCRPRDSGSSGVPRSLQRLIRPARTTDTNAPSARPIPSPRRLSTTSRLWHPRPSIGASDWMASIASGKASTATSTRAVAGDRPRSPIARPSGTNRMTLRLVSPRWRYWESGASPIRPKSHRPGAEGRPLNPPASGGIVATSTAPTLMTRRNAIQLLVRRRRATRPATASAITAVTANPGRNHGRTPAKVLKGSPP